MKVVPHEDRLLVKPADEEEVSKGGIVLPAMAQEKPQIGEVLAIGSGVLQEDGSIRRLRFDVGERILYSKYGGTEINVDGDDLLVLRESDVLGTVIDA